jgi:8-oxo-dGTP diphosphatase
VKSDSNDNSFPLYRIVSGIILSDNKLLLVQNRDESSNYIWGIPGGVVEKGESLKDALCREIKEEAGLDVVDMNLAYIHESYILDLSAHCIVTAFKVEVENNTPAMNDPDGEVVDIQWVHVDQVDQYITNLAVLRPLKEWLTNGNKGCQYFFDEHLVWEV